MTTDSCQNDKIVLFLLPSRRITPSEVPMHVLCIGPLQEYTQTSASILFAVGLADFLAFLAELLRSVQCLRQLYEQ